MVNTQDIIYLTKFYTPFAALVIVYHYAIAFESQPQLNFTLTLNKFYMLSIQQVFLERVGCFFVEVQRLFVYEDPPLEIVKTCSTIALSRGLKVFAVRNGSECLGDKYLPSALPRLNVSEGCRGGRGGRNVSDVYRPKSKRACLFFLFFFYTKRPYYEKTRQSRLFLPQTFLAFESQLSSHSLIILIFISDEFFQSLYSPHKQISNMLKS